MDQNARDKQEEENLCQSVYDAVANAQDRFQVLEGRDRYAMQMELLEWISGDWQEMEVTWLERLH